MKNRIFLIILFCLWNLSAKRASFIGECESSFNKRDVNPLQKSTRDKQKPTNGRKDPPNTGGTHYKFFPSYEEAQRIIQTAKVQVKLEYLFYREENPHLNLPYKPYIVYKDQWIDWGNFLGTGTTSTKLKKL